MNGLRSRRESSRRDAVAHAVDLVGGSLESFYFAFGDHDAYVTVDLPDEAAAVAIALTVNAPGGATTKTTNRLTVEPVDEAARRSVDYTPPGG